MAICVRNVNTNGFLRRKRLDLFNVPSVSLLVGMNQKGSKMLFEKIILSLLIGGNSGLGILAIVVYFRNREK